MELVIHKPDATPNENPYDLEIVSATGLSEGEIQYERSVNMFLSRLFNIGEPDPDKHSKAPLRYNHHKVFREDGKPVVVHIRLELSGTAVIGQLPPTRATEKFDEAAEKLCSYMFHPGARGIFGVLTTRSILGFSAISSVFEKHWTRAFFGDCLSHAPQLLRTIDDVGSYLPSWAMVFHLMTLLELDLGGMRPEGSSVPRGPETELVTLAFYILSKFIDSKPDYSSDTKKWNNAHEDFKLRLDRVYNAMEKVTRSRLLTSEGHQSHAVQLYEEICTALYKATESAAIAFTTNKKIWELFNKVRNESATAAAISAVAAGKNVFGLWKGEKSTVGIGINAVCLAFNAWKCYESYCEMRDANSIMEYLRGMIINITGAWNLASDALILLRWVDQMGGAPLGGNMLGFVSEDRGQAWAGFKKRVKQITGVEVSSEGIDASTVALYLDEQSKTLRKLRERLANNESPISLRGPGLQVNKLQLS